MEYLKCYSIYRIDDINYIGSSSSIIKRGYDHKYIKKIKGELNILATVFLGYTARKMVEQYFIEKYDSINNGANKNHSYISKSDAKKKQNKQKKKYREKNKANIRARRLEKINCPNCNALVSRGNISHHKKSLRCKN